MCISKKIIILSFIFVVFFVFDLRAAAPVDSTNTWALWHMDDVTNSFDPPQLPWYVPDGNSENLWRTNWLSLGGNSPEYVITNIGLYGNALYFDSSNRFISVDGWNNSDTVKIEFDIKPVDFDHQQRLFEVTSALSVRFSPNTSMTYGRIFFYIYDGGTPNLVTSAFLNLEQCYDKWTHVVVAVDSSGNYSAKFGNTLTVIQSGLSGIDDAYSGDPRAFVGGDRLKNEANFFAGCIDEMKISTNPHPIVPDPAVVITNSGGMVNYDITEYSLYGTNSGIVGTMMWSNELSTANGSIPASDGWQITNIPLAVGNNLISVSGTNIYGDVASDSISVTRLPDIPINSNCWAYWKMDYATNYFNPPQNPWYVPNDFMTNPGNTNDLSLGASGPSAVIVAGGVSGKCLYFNGSNRFISVDNWVNSDAISIDCYIKPTDIASYISDQKIFEITSSVSLRLSLNSGYTYGRLKFYVYNDGTPYLVASPYLPVDQLYDNWIHAVATVTPDGDISALLGDKITTLTNAVTGIDDAYSGDGRAFVGGDRSSNSNTYFFGFMDEMKISTIPEPFYLSFIIYYLLIINRKFLLRSKLSK